MASGLPLTGSEHTTATGLALTGSVSNGSWFAGKLRTVIRFPRRLLPSSPSPSTEQSVVHGSISSQSQAQPYVLNLVRRAAREQELSKMLVPVAVSIGLSVGLFFNDHLPFFGIVAVACSLMGFVLVTLGLLGQYMMPTTEDFFEVLGFFMVFVAFEAAVGLFLPKEVFCVLLLILTALISYFVFACCSHAPNTGG